jgi:pimeloyl-ACP methyl ester carboxylesterase
MRTPRLLAAMTVLTVAAGLLGPAAPAGAAVTASHVEGVLPDGSAYVFDVPANWNGTVLLYSHGYVPDGVPNPAQNAPSDAVRSALLDAGYAQIGSSYPETGWVLERALPAQLATLDLFRAQFGPPRRTIAWGTSLGGMITTGLAERYGQRFAGTLAMCGLEQGGVANFNNTLDPLFAIRTLLAPGSTTPLVRLQDQATAFAAIGALTAALDGAQATPEGRARIALAAALHNIPAWTDPSQPEPAPTDYNTAEVNQYGVLHLTIYVGLSWREEAEEHAGGNMSWNTQVDYGRLLSRSSIRTEVEALYRQAGLSLHDDLATLAAAPRITADRSAVDYMIRNISFSGRLIRPMMTIHTTGDPLVPVQVEHAYSDAVRDAHRPFGLRAARPRQVDGPVLLRQAFVHRAGHCTFTTGEMLAALRTLERRITTGHWPDTSPAALNQLASTLDPSATPAYIEYRPAPYPRPFNLGG